jgi:hypothetical protein
MRVLLPDHNDGINDRHSIEESVHVSLGIPRSMTPQKRPIDMGRPGRVKVLPSLQSSKVRARAHSARNGRWRYPVAPECALRIVEAEPAGGATANRIGPSGRRCHKRGSGALVSEDIGGQIGHAS